MKAALEEWLGCGGGRGVKGVLVGTRQGDPNDGQFILIYTLCAVNNGSAQPWT